MIKILFFAQLKEILNCGQMELPCLPTVAAVRDNLAEQGEPWSTAMKSGSTLVAVNQTMANDQTQLQDGDEIAFFPPVTGG